MAQPMPETNLDAWNKPDVASYYSALNYLTPCERLLFEEYLKAGMMILDLGVGGGRTTPYLSSLAARYVGSDYAKEMVETCKKKFPDLEFQTIDASDISTFAAASFDAVVMAFNGIDNLTSDGSRQRAWREMHRVLKPNGVVIFSSHNIRSIFVRPSWNPQRLVQIARRAAGESVFYSPLLWLLTAMRVTLAGFQSMARSLVRILQRVPTRAFWLGAGYRKDRAHGEMWIHFATPEKVEQELRACGFRLLRVLGDDYPRTSRRYVTDWYYYVFAK